MAKAKVNIPAVTEAVKELRKNTLKNVYFIFGEDTFSINETVNHITKKAEQFIATDFDRETLYGDNTTTEDITAASQSFPFGSEKKLIVVKEFEKVKDRKPLYSLLKSPPEFLVLILIHNASVSGFETEFYRILIQNNFIYEAKELKGKYLVNWLVDYAEERGKILSEENAQLMTDISGENRTLLEVQVEKISTFLEDRREITHEVILSQSAHLKEYNIFELQNAIGRRDKSGALKIAHNMLEKGAEPVYIVFMLIRYFTALARIDELDTVEKNRFAASRIIGTHHAYYDAYKAARKIYPEPVLYKAVKALLKAEEMMKTTSTDNKTVITILLEEIMQ